ncbi:MAG: LLM class flavin-dependent oxidoreductase [Acidobacteriota bacterium]|nr:LLM class flavin-dependent oxidoreductase [Acidobacteriota bacterium]
MPDLRFHWSMSSAGVEFKAARARSQHSAVPDMDAHLDFCRHADNNQIDSLLTAVGFHRPDPIAMAAALGVQTSHTRFLVAVRSGIMSPLLFTQQVNTVAALTKGRISLNVVAGHTPAEQRSYGDFLTHDDRYRRTDEFMTICKALWAGEVVTFEGEFYHLEKAAINLPFIAEDRSCPEIYFGGSSDQAYALAAKHADCLLTLPEPPEEMAPRIRPLLEADTEVGLLVSILARPTRDQAVNDAYAVLEKVGNRAKKTHRDFSKHSDSVAFTGQIRKAEEHSNHWLTPTLWNGAVPFMGAPAIALVGSYTEVAETIMSYKQAGVTQFLFMGWPDLAEMNRFGSHVLPLVREMEPNG